MTSKTNQLHDIHLSRVKDIETVSSELILNGIDLTPLLLRDPKSLKRIEIEDLKKCYKFYGLEYVYRVAQEAKIIPFAAYVFIAINLDRNFWQPKYDFYVDRNNKIKDLVNEIFKKLKRYDCKSLTLTENFAVILSSNTSIACFCSGDVDLSADINERESITACLNSLDFFSKEQPKKIGEYSGQSMMFFNKEIIEGGFWVNVVWKPVTRAFFEQLKYEESLLKDRLLSKLISGTQIRVLNDTSLLYFCALHISAGHYYTLSPGLRLYVDIDRLVRNTNIDWEEIIKWTIADNAGIRISLVFYISKLILKTPIPKNIYKDLFLFKRNQRLLNYLVDPKTLRFQNKSSKLRRLYVEIASDNKNLIINFFHRLLNKLLKY